MTFCAAFLTGCVGTTTEPLFVDVARKPPITNPETPAWLVRNDRPLAEWVEEMAQACDDLGC